MRFNHIACWGVLYSSSLRTCFDILLSSQVGDKEDWGITWASQPPRSVIALVSEACWLAMDEGEVQRGSPTTTTDDKTGGGEMDCTKEPPRPKIDHLNILSEQQWDKDRCGVGMLDLPDFKRRVARAWDSGSRTGVGLGFAEVFEQILAPVKVGVESLSIL
jgi:hypothetical protein